MKYRLLFLLMSLVLCLSLHSQDFDELNGQADKEIEKGNYQQSVLLASRANSIKINARSYGILGYCHYMLGEYETAIDDYTKALACHKRNAGICGCIQE